MWRHFQESGSASAAKGWMAGGTGAPMLGRCSGQGTRRELGIKGWEADWIKGFREGWEDK